MALKTALEQLIEVQAAITAVLNNQSYTLDGRTVSRAQLKDLYSMQKDLQKQYNNESGVRPRVAAAKFGSAFN
jgi:hypothetical protein